MDNTWPWETAHKQAYLHARPLHKQLQPIHHQNQLFHDLYQINTKQCSTSYLYKQAIWSQIYQLEPQSCKKKEENCFEIRYVRETYGVEPLLTLQPKHATNKHLLSLKPRCIQIFIWIRVWMSIRDANNKFTKILRSRRWKYVVYVWWVF